MARANRIANMVLIGESVFYLPMTHEDDWETPIMQFSLNVGKQRKIRGTDRDSELQAMCLDRTEKQLVVVGRRYDPDYGSEMPPLDYFVAILGPGSPTMNILHLFERAFLRPTSEVEAREVDGCCVLSDGSLAFGTKSVGEGDVRSALYCFSFETREVTQIANGYRPDAIEVK